MEDIDKQNIFYRPENKPDRHYESAGQFQYQEQPKSSTTTETDGGNDPLLTTRGQLDDVLDDLTVLLDVIPVLPNSIQNTLTDITSALIKDTIKQISDLPSVPSPDNKNEETEETTKEIEYTIPNNTGTTTEDYDDDSEWNLDDLFQTESDITVEESTAPSFSDILSAIYQSDRLNLKKEYVSDMWISIQKYLQRMFAVSNETDMPDFTVFLEDFDRDAVVASNANTKHLHDIAARMDIMIQEESRLFQKTHSSDETLMMLRNLDSAYQQRMKYYQEEYGGEDTLLGMDSNRMLTASRRNFDDAYNSSVLNAYKYLKSASHISDKVMKQTALSSEAKGQLLNKGVDVFAKSPEPAVMSIQNSAYVVPSITAESDLKNRYETPIGAGTSSGSSGSSGNHGDNGKLINGSGPVPYTEYDFNALVACLAAEGGGNSHEFKLAVASVILNRVADSDYPNTINEVILQPGQYQGSGSDEWWSGSGRLTDDCTACAKEILASGSRLPANVVYQAGFEQGSGVYTFLENNYFCYK